MKRPGKIPTKLAKRAVPSRHAIELAFARYIVKARLREKGIKPAHVEAKDITKAAQNLVKHYRDPTRL